MKHLSRLALFLLVSLGISGQAISSERGTTSADFLKIGLGAAAAGMGEACVARSGEANAVFYNPAGLAGVERTLITATHLNWIAETRYEALAYARPILGIGSIGTSLFLLHMPPIPAMDENGIPQGEVAAYDLGIQFSYARDLASWLGATGLAAGANLKILHRNLAGLQASGFAADLGAIYAVNDHLSLGLAGMNLGYLSSFDSEPEKLPVIIRTGACYSREFSAVHGLAISTDVVQPLDNSLRANFGLEYTFYRLVSLRIGYKWGYDSDGFQAGAGLRWGNLSLDYALKLMGVFGVTHFVSASAGFGASIKELQRDQAQRFLREAERLYSQSRYEKAMGAVERAVAIDPEDPTALQLKDKLRTVVEMLKMPAGQPEVTEEKKSEPLEGATPDELEEKGLEVSP